MRFECLVLKVAVMSRPGEGREGKGRNRRLGLGFAWLAARDDGVASRVELLAVTLESSLGAAWSQLA